VQQPQAKQAATAERNYTQATRQQSCQCRCWLATLLASEKFTCSPHQGRGFGKSFLGGGLILNSYWNVSGLSYICIENYIQA